MILAQIEKCDSRKYNYTARKRLGHRKTDSRNQQLIRAQPLDPHSAESISKDIEKEKLTLVFLMFAGTGQAGSGVRRTTPTHRGTSDSPVYSPHPRWSPYVPASAL